MGGSMHCYEERQESDLSSSTVLQQKVFLWGFSFLNMYPHTPAHIQGTSLGFTSEEMIIDKFSHIFGLTFPNEDNYFYLSLQVFL